MFFLTALFGLILGIFIAFVTILYARYFLNKQLTAALQKELLNNMQNMQSIHIPDALRETIRQCMHGAITRFREKMPFIGSFITPPLIQSMEEIMLEELQKHWPSLLKGIIPSLVPSFVHFGLYQRSFIKIWIAYSAFLGFLVGFFIGFM